MTEKQIIKRLYNRVKDISDNDMVDDTLSMEEVENCLVKGGNDFTISGNIDWKHIRKQKEFLVRCDTEQAEGLLCFLDSVQDSAIESDNWTHEEVFGIKE